MRLAIEAILDYDFACPTDVLLAVEAAALGQLHRAPVDAGAGQGLLGGRDPRGRGCTLGHVVHSALSIQKCFTLCRPSQARVVARPTCR
mgnify:CR=1 FL=1